MGSGIALVAAQAGAQVVIFDVNEDACAKSREAATNSLHQSVERGRLLQDQADRFLKSMRWTSSLGDLGHCTLVIEAILEDQAVKQALFAELEDIVGNEVIIASNTSSLSIARLAKPLRHPGRFAGMHFFNPPTAMKLVEVVSGPATAPHVAQTIAAIAAGWKKVAVQVADVPGFIVNRVARPYYAEGFQALQQSAAPAEVIDHLFKSAAGFRMGPLELTDLIGQDVNFSVARTVYDSYFGQTRFVPQLLQASLVDAGWLGRKSGRGIYDYSGTASKVIPEPIAANPLKDAPPRPECAGPGQTPLEIGGMVVRFTRGQTARAEARTAGKPVVVLDWFEAATAQACGFAASDDKAAEVGARLLAAWNLAPFRIADTPGLIVTRTLAQIANAAGDAVLECVSDEVGIDSALQFGANYPFGPFAWTEQLGGEAVVVTLQAIALGTGHAIYNPSQYWMSRI
jgi:3-hydroxybutyryl-CoA dehydrogenase